MPNKIHTGRVTSRKRGRRWCAAEFNAYVAENIDRITKRAPKEVRGTLRPCSQQALAIRYPRLTHKAPLPFSPPPSECRPRRRS